MRRGVVLAVVVAACAVGASPAAASRLEKWTIASKFVDPAKTPMTLGSEPRALHVNVLLPDGYDGKRRFPVLYLLHGHGGNYHSWTDAGGGDLQYVVGGLQAIVVVPEGGNGWYANWWNGGRDGGGRAWEYFFEDEVVPMVEKRLRVLPGRSNRALGGLSMGGEGSAFLGAMMPGYFGAVLPFSGPLSIRRLEWPIGFDTQGEDHNDVFGDIQKQAFYWQGHDPTTLAANYQHTRLFVRTGDGIPDLRSEGEVTDGFAIVSEFDLRQHAEDFVRATRAVGADVHYEPMPGVHQWQYWRLALRSAIKWGLFKPQPTPTSWIYKTVAQHGRAWDLRYEFTSPPGTLQTFRREGSALSATGSGTVRITPDGARAFTATLPFRMTLVPKKRAGSGRRK